MNVFLKCHVSFRISDDKLNPLEITNMLGIEPSISHKQGDSNTSISKKGKLIKFSPYSSGLWCIDSKEAENRDLQVCLSNIETTIEAKIRLVVRSDRWDINTQEFISLVRSQGTSFRQSERKIVQVLL